MITTIYEDDDVVVVNKPAGLASQNTANNEETLLDVFGKNLLPVHRLDQRVSGIILLAKNKESLSILQDDFKARNIKKFYRAIVANAPPKQQDTLIHWLIKDGKQSKAKVYAKEIAHSKQCVLAYKLIQSSLKYHLLEIELFTGRFHQIRAQLSSISCPIVGDVKYGFKRSSPDGSIFLQSFRLEFSQPKNKEILSFNIDMPELWKKYGF